MKQLKVASEETAPEEIPSERRNLRKLRLPNRNRKPGMKQLKALLEKQHLKRCLREHGISGN